MQEINSAALASPRSTAILWGLFSVITVISAIPLVVLSLFLIFIVGTSIPNELNLGVVLFALFPGIFGAAGFTGLVLAVQTPPNADDRKKVRRISFLMGLGLTVLSLTLILFTWLWPIAVLPILMAVGYILSYVRKSSRRSTIGVGDKNYNQGTSKA